MSAQDASAVAVNTPVAQIAAIRGASNRAIQEAMWRFARRWSDRGVRIAGLLETFAESDRPAQKALRLQNIRSGESYPLFQNLGPMSTACHLEGSGIVAACVGICAEIDTGCDLVILSKLGQLEALRSGLMEAFIKAVGREIPVLTAVSPAYAGPWNEDCALDTWWCSLTHSLGV
jgi:hypothetical protein